MKLRYYLRGLGIGIIVTALVLGFSLDRKKQTMSDLEVKARAKELGMVENTVLSSLPHSSEAKETTEETINSVSLEDEQEVDTKDTEEKNQEPEEQQVVTFVINWGESSGTVSHKLEEAGLIEDAKSFDQYLMNHGYSKSITTGTHEIPKDSTDEDIAQLITK